MSENTNTAKRRERIKTILIIFLAIMLVLTFFSGTIQNYSLPTVSAQYASYGTITEKVRGSGTVNANQNYEVTAEGTRVVASVSVKAGDEVAVGDTLFVLEASNSDEAVKEAENALAEAELAYQKALLTAVPDYAAENQEITNARQDLQTAIQRLNEASNQSGTISESEYNAAKNTVTACTAEIAELEGYQTALESGSINQISSTYSSKLTGLKKKLQTAESAVADAQAEYDRISAGITVSSGTQQETVNTLERTAQEAEVAYTRAQEDYEASGDDVELKRAMEDAQQAMIYAQDDLSSAQTVLQQIQEQEKSLAQAETQLKSKQSIQTQAQADYDQAVSDCSSALSSAVAAQKAALDTASNTVTAYEGQGTTDIDALEDAVTQQERTLQNLLISLAETKKSNTLTEEINSLDLQSQSNAIDKQKEELEELKKSSGTLVVTSKNAGVVSSVGFAAGDTVNAGDVLANITLTDSGYTLQFTVTAEQARKLKTGMKADITNDYYSDITAQLVSMKTDTEHSGSTDRILTFEISGSDVTPGQSLSLSLSCSSQSYDCVVPTSAIMEDTEGKFVLIVNAKSTPLGNKYFASRVAVTVLASDELNSAVQGDLNSWDFVITASEKPLSNGKQIRMED